ncbi:MAG: DUF3601 domain-containing protein [Gammaproteobacteria bacterium]|nr:DUF3601 domain-containing protein [Gammaproteobacteria bacterium]
MTPKGIMREKYQDYLVPGKKYRVVKPFLDATKSVHPAGETWTFLGYLPNGFGEATYISIAKEDKTESGFGIDWNYGENNLGLENIKNFIQEIS